MTYLSNTGHELERRELEAKGMQILLKKPWYSWILCVITLSLIVQVYLTFVVYLCLPLAWEFDRPILALAYFFICTVPVGLLLYSYFKTVFTHPGLVPSVFHLSQTQKDNIQNNGWDQFIRSTKINGHDESDDETENDRMQENDMFLFEKTSAGEIRYCSTCLTRKPDRTRHCRICGTCILKMDHHCPWVNNCVGFYNFKYFILFVFYTIIASLIVAFTMMDSMVEIFKQAAGEKNSFAPGFTEVIVLWNVLFSLLSGMSLALFLGFHLKLILSNMTTIEYLQKYSKFMEQYYQNPYDLGLYKNLQAVFGEKWYLWLIPTYDSVPGYGTSFPIRNYMQKQPSPYDITDDHAVINIDEKTE